MSDVKSPVKINIPKEKDEDENIDFDDLSKLSKYLGKKNWDEDNEIVEQEKDENSDQFEVSIKKLLKEDYHKK